MPFHPHRRGWTCPSPSRTRTGLWYGFAARARILIVNTKSHRRSQSGLAGSKDLVDPRGEREDWHRQAAFWNHGHPRSMPLCRLGRGEGGEAVFQGSEIQRACKFSRATSSVAHGSRPRARLHWALTDTDDAMGEVDAGSPVAIVYPDRGAPDALGTLYIPNTLADHQGLASPEGSLCAGRLSPSARRSRRLWPGGPIAAQIPLLCSTKIPGAGRDARRRSTPWPSTSRRRPSSGTRLPHSLLPNSHQSD